MIEKLIELLKDFFEKYFIQALIAVLPTIFIYYKTPEDFDFLKKLGKELYCTFFFIICFLMIMFIITVFKKINNFRKSKIYEREANKELEKENIEALWNCIDNLDAKEKNIVKYFLENNNRVVYAYGHYNLDVLFELCNSSKIESDGTMKAFDFFKLVENEKVEAGCQLFQFKLKDNIYELLKYSKSKYGKISNFE